MHLHRRNFILGAAAGLTLTARAGGAAASPQLQVEPGQSLFTFDVVKQRAAELARRPWVKPSSADHAELAAIDYENFQNIHYRPDRCVYVGGAANRQPVQFFHRSKLFTERVRVHAVETSKAREIDYSADMFDTKLSPLLASAQDVPGFAGFRVMAPDLKTDWLSFLGASYFRTSAPLNQYGISARGIAINTGQATPEEFPCFVEFWLEAPEAGADSLVVHALLDGPSLTGAYRIRVGKPGSGDGPLAMDVELELNPRVDVAHFGVAPFSSMFWYGKTYRNQSVDWRPEIHDSDGLAVALADGEHIWRPLNNPPRLVESAFPAGALRGFGLMQRARDFIHYLDDGIFYERRPSVWVEPRQGFERGSVRLFEIPTDDETNDNIVAYWSPEEPLRAGVRRRFSYRLSWVEDMPLAGVLAKTTATLSGMGGVPGIKRPPGVRKFVIDFQGPSFKDLGREDGVELVVKASRGKISNAYNLPVAGQREHWRALFDIEVKGPEPVELTAKLVRGGRPLTETWVYQYHPELESEVSKTVSR